MKKTFIALILTLGIMVSLITIPLTHASEVNYIPTTKTNLIKNGGFENGDSSWTVKNNVGVGSGATSSNMLSGAKSYKYVLGASNGHLGQQVEVFPSYDMNIINQKNTKYIVVAHVLKGDDYMSNNLDLSMSFRILISDSKVEKFIDIEATSEDKVSLSTKDSGYVSLFQIITLQEKYTLSDGNAYKWYSFQIIFKSNSASGSVYLDDISMNYVETGSVSGKIDNFFTSGVTSETAIGVPFCGSNFLFAGGNSDYSIDLKTSYKNTEGASLRYTPSDKGDGTNIYMTVPISYFSNDIYTFSFMVKGKNAAIQADKNVDFPWGIYSFPWLRGDGEGDTRFPEQLTYRSDDTDYGYRPFVNGIYQNGGVVVDKIKKDFDWKKVSIKFNPNAFVSEAKATNGKIYSGKDIVDFALILYTHGLEGEYWFDSFKMYRDGTPEPDFTNDFDINSEKVQRGYINESITLPLPTSNCQVDNEIIDVSSDIRMTVTDPMGEKIVDNELQNTGNRTFVTNKTGYYKVEYSIVKDTRERELMYEFYVGERDITLPVLTLHKKNLTVKTNEILSLPTATAVDDTDGDISSYTKVNIVDKKGNLVMHDNQANVSVGYVFDKPGEYYARYSVMDKSGNVSLETRLKITVTDKEKEHSTNGCGGIIMGNGKSGIPMFIMLTGVICLCIMNKKQKSKAR